MEEQERDIERERLAREKLREQLRHNDFHGWFGLKPEAIPQTSLLEMWEKALHGRGSPDSPQSVSAYVHVPFCPQSCNFCHYLHIVPRGRDPMARYTAYLDTTFGRYVQALGTVDIASAYWGGGTPTAMSSQQLTQVLRGFRKLFRIGGQFTMESHPGTLNDTKLAVMRDAGVNRISMGVQSFEVDVLKHAGRLRRTPEQLSRLLEQSQTQGIEVNLDMILGLPGQTQESASSDLRRLLNLGPDTITVYRYQPTERLPAERRPELEFGAFFSSRSLLRDLLLAGYVPLLRPDSAYSVVLLRLSSRTVRRMGTQLRTAAKRVVAPQTPSPQYWPPMDERNVHVMGFGVGAVSHVYGHAWYVDTSSLDVLDAGHEPLTWGTRTTPESEIQRRLLAELLDEEAVMSGAGHSPLAEFHDSLASRWTSLSRRVSTGARRALKLETSADTLKRQQIIDGLIATVVDRWNGLDGVRAFAQTPHVQARLFPGFSLWTNSVPSELSRLLSATPASEPGPPQAIDVWCQIAGVGRAGATWQGALVEGVGNDRVTFQVLPAPHPPLQVFVRWKGSGGFFRQSEQFEFSHGKRDTPLHPTELEFVEACARADRPMGELVQLDTRRLTQRRVGGA